MMKMRTKLDAALNGRAIPKSWWPSSTRSSVNPSAEAMIGPMKLTALIKLDDQDKALEYAKKLAKSDLSKHAQGLNTLAWAIVDPGFRTQTQREADRVCRRDRPPRRRDGRRQGRGNRRHSGQGVLRLW